MALYELPFGFLLTSALATLRAVAAGVLAIATLALEPFSRAISPVGKYRLRQWNIYVNKYSIGVIIIFQLKRKEG